MSLQARKNALRKVLSTRDLTEIRGWAVSERNPLRMLFSFTYDPDELIRWRAVEAIGLVAGDQANTNLDKVRDVIRHLLWLMNDESGGLSPLAPEMIGEILVNVPSLIEEYGPLLPSFLQEEPFVRGSHLAIWRVAMVRPGVFGDAIEQFRLSLVDTDPAVRAYAARTIMAIDMVQSEGIKMQLCRDDASFSFYEFESGKLRHTTVARMISCQSDCDTNSERAA